MKGRTDDKQRVNWRELDWGTSNRQKASSQKGKQVTGSADLSIKMGQRTTKIALMYCGVCHSVDNVMVFKYDDQEYHVECHGCDQHVGLPVVTMPLHEAVATWNLDQTRMIRLMAELPNNVLSS